MPGQQGRDGPRYGEPVLVLLPNGQRKVIVPRPGGFTDTRYGRISHDALTSVAWGAGVKTSTGAHVEVHRPSLPDIQMGLATHGTQVIYPKDTSLMTLMAGVGRGSRVAEAGFGSAFLTMVLACTVAPQGRVYAYDVNPRVLATAEKNLGLVSQCRDVVELRIHDVRQGIPQEGLDAVFLDMPDPWNVLEPAHRALKPSGSLVVFLPTVNQVSKLLREVQRHGGFTDPRVLETQVREYQANPEALRPLPVQVVHTGYMVFLRSRLKGEG